MQIPLSEDQTLIKESASRFGQEFGGAERLRRLRDESTAAGFDVPELSVGMSGDYPIAVEEGATMLRLGTVLLGERHQ